MAEASAIEWTDATWNPTVGCSIVSPGCTNCYAMRAAWRLHHAEKYAGLTELVNGNPVWTGAVRLDEAALTLPLRWRKPRRIFVDSMSDVFHEGLADAAIDKVFAVMALAPRHTFQVLTKRAARMLEYFSGSEKDVDRWHVWRICQAIDKMIPWRTPQSNAARQRMASALPLPNVWLGVSVERQAEADARIPALLETPAAVRFLSCEPLLGPLDLRVPFADGDRRHRLDALTGQALLHGAGVGGNPDLTVRLDKPVAPRLDWVICGGESGPQARARPMHPDWARSLRDQCSAAGVSFFMKQMTKRAPIPDDLMVREFPNV